MCKSHAVYSLNFLMSYKSQTELADLVYLSVVSQASPIPFRSANRFQYRYKLRVPCVLQSTMHCQCAASTSTVCDIAASLNHIACKILLSILSPSPSSHCHMHVTIPCSVHVIQCICSHLPHNVSNTANTNHCTKSWVVFHLSLLCVVNGIHVTDHLLPTFKTASNCTVINDSPQPQWTMQPWD